MFYIFFIYFSIVFIHYLLLICYFFNYFGILGSFGVLDLGLFGGKANMCWNFNGCGDFCGGDFGEWNGLVGGKWKMAQRVGIGGVGCGRAWVSSLPNFFLVNSFHFWKPPPYLCINNIDNVYYPIFSGCYIISITNIEYVFLCIINECLSVRTLSQTQRFRLW